MAHTNLGVALLVAGQWTEGWVEYESRFDIDPHRQNFPWPRWNGEDLTGRKILLSCEQGLGDLIQFLRFADALIERGAEVWLLCTEQGEELLSTYPGIRCVARPPLPEFDYHSCLMSLPRVLGITRNNVPAKVPYLFANEPRREFWRARLPGQGTLRVGLVWRCSQGFIRDQWRSMNLEELAPIFGTPGVTFISLQKGPGLDELGRLGPTLGLHDLGPEYQAGNLGDTAAIIAELDLVISVDTSVTHLAGALARPVWLAVNQPPDWRWERTGSTSRWYPTVRLFRQRALNQWRPVVEEMRHALQQRLETPATPQG